MDTLVVLFAWIEIGWGYGQEELSMSDGDSGNVNSSSGNLPPLRILRLFRVLRSMRVVRAFRFFTELRLVLLSLFHSVKPLLWCFFALGILLFVFSVLFMQ